MEPKPYCKIILNALIACALSVMPAMGTEYPDDPAAPLQPMTVEDLSQIPRDAGLDGDEAAIATFLKSVCPGSDLGVGT